jgi:hypothetical protein
MLEGPAEPTVGLLFSPWITDDVKYAVRVIE